MNNNFLTLDEVNLMCYVSLYAWIKYTFEYPGNLLKKFCFNCKKII